MSSSPNTTCRVRPSRRTTCAPTRNGFIWYSNFVEPYLGRLDPRTGAHEEFRYPLPKPNFPSGALALEPDHDGNWWLALMFQGGLMKFDARNKRSAIIRCRPG